MQPRRHRSHMLAVVAVTATIGLGTTALTVNASGGIHLARSLRSLGAPSALPSSLPAAPAGCVISACDIYAMPGTVTAGTSGPIDRTFAASVCASAPASVSVRINSTGDPSGFTA